jgi:hypothetical protein
MDRVLVSDNAYTAVSFHAIDRGDKVVNLCSALQLVNPEDPELTTFSMMYSPAIAPR